MSTCEQNSKSLISVNQAREKILDMIDRVSETETVKLEQSHGRILAEQVKSKIDIPCFDNSAMDGYAVSTKDCNNCKQLKVVGISWAGKPWTGQVKQGQCIRIMTGAALPDGCDAVIMQENVTLNDDQITIEHPVKQGQNIRWRAEEIASGDTVLNPGKLLMAVDTGLLASVGANEVTVFRKPRVAFFSTGDELRPVGSPLQQGQIYDSNRYLLNSALSRLGVETHDLGVIPDDPDKILQAFEQASELADLVMTSGGVSVGDADHVQDILKSKGEVNFWRVAMKPGKPLAVGKFNDAYFFGVPGNPVSALVTFYQFVQPGLKKLMGNNEHYSPSVKARCLDELKKLAGRQEFQRGILSTDDNGDTVVSTSGLQGSHMLTSMSNANCFIVLPRENNGVQPGEIVEVQPFYGII